MSIKDFKRSAGSAFKWFDEGDDSSTIVTPFRFDDGDHFGVAIQREGDGWILTDRAFTYGHLLDMLCGENMWNDPIFERIVKRVKARFDIKERDGEFFMRVEPDDFGAQLCRFMHGLIRIAAFADNKGA